MNVSQDRAKSIFLSAAEIASSDERRAFVATECSGDEALQAEVEELLRHAQALGDFLESPAVDFDAAPAEASGDWGVEQPGTVVGPYKLLHQIGEGGMGVVFMAEQTEPIQRTVALKIIKPGMDTRQVIARFEAERQALAVMDHPNIAKVLDAGTTGVGLPPRGRASRSQSGILALGRPYFVMELVKGVPITEYCDRRRMGVRQRLELFAQVCQAVQHAHQKGIIHRDIKPTNVLVAEYDGRPVPKIIDFGVAKATAPRLAEKTMFTEFGQLLGTLEYMSPEQASFNQLDIDTRSDIYSLGVLLYELLAGSTPFEQKRLREAAFDEILRIVREEEPPKPSIRLGTSETLPSIAANRQCEPTRLSKEVQGELDWIVMRSLEKDRQRRYETASSLADDVQRYLHNEPIQARPTTWAYRLRKFSRRNKAGVFASAAVIASLLLGLTAATAGFLQASRQARSARTQADRATRTQQFLREMLTSVNPDAKRGGAVTVPQMLDRASDRIDSTFANQPEIRIDLHETIGQAYYGLVLHKQAAPHLKSAVQLRQRFLPEETVALADAHLRLGQAYSWDPSQIGLALSQCREALSLYKGQVLESDPRLVVASSLEAQLARQTSTAEQARSDIWAARALPIALALSDDQVSRLPEPWAVAVADARKLSRSGDRAGAIKALDRGRTAVLTTVSKMCAAGQPEQAGKFVGQVYKPLLEIRLLREIVPVAIISEAWELKHNGTSLPVIEVMLRDAVVAGQSVWGPEHAYIARALADLAVVLQQQNKLAEAEQVAREALAMRRKLLGMEDQDTISSVSRLIDVLIQEDKKPEADNLRREFILPDDAPAMQSKSK